MVTLRHDEWGRLIFTDANGGVHVGVEPVRAFPIHDPDCDISLLDTDGREVFWIENLSTQPDDFRQRVTEELNRRHFLPVIERIANIEGITEPTTWEIVTDRGRTRFQLKSEEDVRRVTQGRVIIADRYGVRYLIPDYRQLDATSRRYLERYI